MDKKNIDKSFELIVNEEVSRCLLCHDAPCSKACPAQTNPAKFIRSLRFENPKGAIETIKTNNVLGGICSKVCPSKNYCENACSRANLNTPIKIKMIQEYLMKILTNAILLHNGNIAQLMLSSFVKTI
jgi:dihydropyrimidine dehydrogenase (NAD+) subunit PreT